MHNKIDHIKELGRDINKKMQKTVDSSMYGTGMALGTKTLTGVLVDGQKFEYSGSDCMILDHLLLEEKYTTEIANEHKHDIITPDNFKIESGDRVLVALLGNACVIVGRVTNG